MHLASPEESFERAIRVAVRGLLGIELQAVPISIPPNAAQGDVASPVCFELARAARRAPKQIAAEVAAAMPAIPGIERIECAGSGYLNAFFDRPALLRAALLDDRRPQPSADGPKIVVEHTNINPNKAAHIGHLRNAVLGDTLVRCLRRLGERVEVQNYIDDTGVQVADLAVGFVHLRGEDLETVAARYPDSPVPGAPRLDYVAWDLYAEVTRWYQQDDKRLAVRAETLHRMEARDNPTAELADYLARRMVRHHLATMHRLGVVYDLLPRESDILALRFWDEAFTRLREAGAIRLLEEGKHVGCWVMDIEGAEPGSGEDQKVIVRSNGTVTYVGKDIAYQMWKFGLLARDFRYVRFPWAPDDELYPAWSTNADRDDLGHPAFGHAERVYNVIDTRQAYLQRVVAQGLRALGFHEQADRSIHFQYEMVALSPASVAAMFPDFPMSEQDRARPYLEMSGRRGLGVRADDLVDTLIERARAEVVERNPGMPEHRREDTARRIAVGALRYYMLRYTRNRVVAFDLDAALSFEGETGPYLQYSVVRAKNILAKVADSEGPQRVSAAALSAEADLARLPQGDLADHWNLALMLLRVPAVLRQAVDSLELAVIAKHAYVLAQEFNTFYHRFPVAQEPDPAVRAVRLALVRLYHDGMTDLLGVMGIEVPERM